MTTATARETSLENKHERRYDDFAIVPLRSPSTLLEKDVKTRLVWATLSCLHNCKCSDFTLLFCRGQRGIVLMCVLHMHHSSHSSFNK